MSAFIDTLAKDAKEDPYLVHAKSILTQYRHLENSKIKSDQEKFEGLIRIAEEYRKYYEVNIQEGTDDKVIRKRVAALNAYYNFIHDAGFDNLFNPQTKFRPTILEEFMALLFRDLIQDVQRDCPCSKLGLGSVKAYANLYFYGKDFKTFVANPTIGLNVKDQDFAIYRNVSLKMDDNKPVLASLPIVAVECKTFIDKTMLEGSVATAEKLKTGNPYALFCMVSELYDVAQTVDPAYSRIDQIYILRKTARRGERKDIDASVVIGLMHDVKRHLERPWCDVAKKLADTGTLI